MYDNDSRTLRRRLKAEALTAAQKKENDNERTDTGPGGLIPFLMLTVGIGEILAIGVLGNLLLAMLSGYRRLFK